MGVDGGGHASARVAVTLAYDVPVCTSTECTAKRCTPKAEIPISDLNQRLKKEWATCRLITKASSIFEVDCGSCERHATCGFVVTCTVSEDMESRGFPCD